MPIPKPNPTSNVQGIDALIKSLEVSKEQADAMASAFLDKVHHTKMLLMKNQSEPNAIDAAWDELHTALKHFKEVMRSWSGYWPLGHYEHSHKYLMSAQVGELSEKDVFGISAGALIAAKFKNVKVGFWGQEWAWGKFRLRLYTTGGSNLVSLEILLDPNV